MFLRSVLEHNVNSALYKYVLLLLLLLCGGSRVSFVLLEGFYQVV